MLSNFLLLQSGWLLSSVQASNHICSPAHVSIQEILILPQSFFGEQMVRGSDLVVAISLDAFDGVVRVVVELVEHHLIHFIVYWHWLLAWEEALRSLVLLLLEPRVASDVTYSVSFIRLSAEDL